MRLVSVRETRTTGAATRHIAPERKLLLAVASGGRCEFRGCNKFLFTHPVSLSNVNLSKHAHIYAFSTDGPRGDAPARPADIHSVENVMLMCGECHDEIDKNEELYSVEVLKEHKREHEERIRYLTGLGPEARTSVVVLKASIGGRAVDVSFDEIRDAVAPRYPSDREGYAIDLGELGDENSADYYAAAARRIKQRMDAFYERRIDGTARSHVSAFGLAPIPLLMHFGRCLSDKVELDLFQRHRGEAKPWRWQVAGEPARYERRLLRSGKEGGKVGVLLSLSGLVDPASLGASLTSDDWLYEIRLVSEPPNRSFLSRRRDLVEFRRTYEAFLSELVAAHPGLHELHVFPAVPAPVAIMCGHAVLPKVHPALLVYDNDKALGGFVQRLTVNDHEQR